MRRFFCEYLDENGAQLEKSELHHLLKVCRFNEGDQVELFDGKGAFAIGEINAVSKKEVEFSIRDFKRSDRPVFKLILAVSVPKGDRLDMMIEKCTELGADVIYPTIFERTVKNPGNPKILDRWKRIAVAASKQSKRLYLPEIYEPNSLLSVLERIETDHREAQVLVADPGGETGLIQCEFRQDTAAVIGPEGGFTEDELGLLEVRGVQKVKLTETILRVETAAIAAAVILSTNRSSANS